MMFDGKKSPTANAAFDVFPSFYPGHALVIEVTNNTGRSVIHLRRREAAKLIADLGRWLKPGKLKKFREERVLAVDVPVTKIPRPVVSRPRTAAKRVRSR